MTRCSALAWRPAHSRFTCDASWVSARTCVCANLRFGLETAPDFRWLNTVLGNLKTLIKGAHKSFKFGKYAQLYLGAFNYRFNRDSTWRVWSPT